jgi:hypothetical protein
MLLVCEGMYLEPHVHINASRAASGDCLGGQAMTSLFPHVYVAGLRGYQFDQQLPGSGMRASMYRLTGIIETELWAEGTTL